MKMRFGGTTERMDIGEILECEDLAHPGLRVSLALGTATWAILCRSYRPIYCVQLIFRMLR